MRTLRSALLAALAATALAGCSGDVFSPEEVQKIRSLSLAALPPLPPDPTNRHADNPAAAALGSTLFFDQRLSRDGSVACGTCHVIDRQFQDDRPRGVALGTTDRRTMPLAGVARSPFLFWDGRRDSLWAQAITPLEDSREHGGNRVAYVRFLAEHFRERYERIFGPLPDLARLPQNASPRGNAAEQAAWAAMDEAERDAIDRAFSNIGKAIAAFERSLTHPQTRFDRFAAALTAGSEPAADAALSEDEIAGLRLFIGRANCSTCHTGPRFSDEHFHNTGVPAAADGLDDLGRESGVKEADADPFNCLGKFSDAGPEGCGELRFTVRQGPELTRAYKTPSLRGAATRPPYMHAGQIGTLEDVVDHYARAPKAPSGTSELHPVRLSERERAQLVAFLKTLEP